MTSEVPIGSIQSCHRSCLASSSTQCTLRTAIVLEMLTPANGSALTKWANRRSGREKTTA